MSDIFREVDEAMQQDKLMAIWQEYRNTIIAAIAILIVSSTLTTIYKNWDAKRNAEETARLTTALQAEDPQVAIQEVIKDTRKGHQAIGLMSAANLQLKDGKQSEAAERYKEIALNKKSPRNIRDLARILYVQNTETADIDLLQPLLANGKSPWVWHARIEAAVITAHDKQDYEGALYYLNKFETEQAKYVPATLRQRAQALAHVYTLKSQIKTSKTVNETDATTGEKK